MSAAETAVAHFSMRVEFFPEERLVIVHRFSDDGFLVMAMSGFASLKLRRLDDRSDSHPN